MVIGLDSAAPPSAAQVAAAQGAGVAVWGGYLATKPNVGLLRPWSQAEFTVAKALSGVPLAFASGWDDPVRCQGLAAAWGVRLCLDVEGGIRGDGNWVQPWLDLSGAGLYGQHSVDSLGRLHSIHVGRNAPFHIAAWYVNHDPVTTWPAGTARPVTPCGWQWQNSHNAFGVTVDRSWLDDWFGGTDMTQAEFDALCANSPWIAGLGWRTKALIENTLTVEGGPQGVAGTPNALRAELDTIKMELEALKNAPGGSAPTYQGTVILTPK
jgi:hypothetical protein